MRLILFFAGIFILGNLIVYLVPKNSAQNNERFVSSEEIAPETIDIIGQRLIVKEQAVEASAINKVAKAKRCYRIGPFLHSARLTLAKTKLNNLGIAFDVEKRPSNTAEVFRIYIGLFQNSQEAMAARQQLSERNIFDHFQRKEQDGRYMVSLGIYSRSISAQSSLERFSEMGVDARMRPEKTVLPSSFWLNLSSEANNSSANTLRKIDWGEHSAQFGSYKCASNKGL